MKLLQRVVGPIATNLYVLGDEASREAIAIDTATPCVDWVTATLAERGWSLKLIVSTHRHWDHIGDNAAVADATGAKIAAHIEDRHGLEHPPASQRALSDPAQRARRRPGRRARRSASARSSSRCCTRPGTPRVRSACWRRGERLLFTGDTLFAGGWGRTDLAGGSEEQIIDSLIRLEPAG